MWIEWGGQLLNLNNCSVIRCEACSFEQWMVEIVPIIRDGNYFRRYFETKESAKNVYENIKKSIMHKCEFEFNIPC